MKSILNAHYSLVKCIKWLGPGNKFLASSGDDFFVNIWDTKSFKFVKRLEGHTNYINTIEIVQDGRLMTGSDDTTIKIWNINSGEVEYAISFSNLKFKYIKHLQDGHLVAIGNRSGIYIINNTNTFDFSFSPSSSYKLETAILVDGQYAFNSFSDQNVFRFNYSSNQIDKTINTHFNITSLERYPIGKY